MDSKTSQLHLQINRQEVWVRCDKGKKLLLLVVPKAPVEEEEEEATVSCKQVTVLAECLWQFYQNWKAFFKFDILNFELYYDLKKYNAAAVANWQRWPTPIPRI